jgi:hypothetical protein
MDKSLICVLIVWFQVQDYGIALKLDDGKEMFIHIARLLKVFFCLGSNLYEGVLLCQLLVLSHLRRHNHPVWQMFHHNLSAFNEECGELSFSVLSRSTQGDSLRSDAVHMNDTYKLIHQYRAVANDFESALYQNQKVDPKGFNVEANSVEVKAMVQFFKAMIQSLKNGTYKPYRVSKTRKSAAYSCKEKEEALRDELKTAEVPKRLFLKDFSIKLNKRIDCIRNNLDSTYYNDFLKNMFLSNLESAPSVSDDFEEIITESEESDAPDLLDNIEAESKAPSPVSVPLPNLVNEFGPKSIRKKKTAVKPKVSKPKIKITNAKKRQADNAQLNLLPDTSRPDKRSKVSPTMTECIRPAGLRSRPRINYQHIRRSLQNDLFEADDDCLLDDYLSS